MGIKHVFVSGKSDSSDTSLVRPSNWNDDHTIDGNVDPDTDNAYSLGSSGTSWSDLYLGDGGVIDWNAGEASIVNNTTSGGLFYRADVGNLSANSSHIWQIDGSSYMSLVVTRLGPTSNDGLALGSDTFSWSDLYLADGAIISWDADTSFITNEVASQSLRIHADSPNTHANSEISLQVDNDDGVGYNGSAFYPKANDTAALGTSSLGWSDIYLAEAGQIIWDNGTHAIVPIAASGDLNIRADTGNTLPNTTIDFAVDGTESVQITSSTLQPFSNDATSLGTSSLGWSDLYLADGGTINANNSENIITFGAQGGYKASAVRFDGGGQGTFPEFTFYTDSAGTDSPLQAFWKESASPADLDYIGDIEFYSEDSASGNNLMAQMFVQSFDVTNTTEDAVLSFWAVHQGSVIRSFVLGAQNLLVNPTNSTDGFSFYTDQGYNGGNFNNDGNGSGGTYLDLYHNTSSPADNSSFQSIRYRGEDSAGNSATWGEVICYPIDVTNGTRSAAITMRVRYENSTTNANARSFNLYSGTVEQTLGNATAYGYIDMGGSNYEPFHFYDNGAGTGGPSIHVYNDSSSPATNDTLGVYYHSGNDSAGNFTTYGSEFCISYDETSATEDGEMNWYGIKAGSMQYFWRFRGGSGAYVPEATGGAKGAGRSNWDAVYDDNTLLTCYVDEAVKTGDVDIEKWDAFALDPYDPNFEQNPRKIHMPARRFKARLGTEYDPTTLKGQRKHLADKKHLTSYPNPDNYEEETRPSIGEWVQSGVEMDELLFEYIQQLEDRIEALEGV